MRFGTTRSQIYDAQKTARAKWEATVAEWDDEIHDRHGEAVVEPLDGAVSDALRAIDQLSVLFTQVRQECEFEG
jgi:hypothetical protein